MARQSPPDAGAAHQGRQVAGADARDHLCVRRYRRLPGEAALPDAAQEPASAVRQPALQPMLQSELALPGAAVPESREPSAPESWQLEAPAREAPR